MRYLTHCFQLKFETSPHAVLIGSSFPFTFSCDLDQAIERVSLIPREAMRNCVVKLQWHMMAAPLARHAAVAAFTLVKLSKCLETITVC